VPKSYYTHRAPYPSPQNLFSLIADDVFPKLIVNATFNAHRLSIALAMKLTVVLLNTGSIRFDLLRGNFTLNDQKMVSPFTNAFMVLRDVVYGDAKIVVDWLNTGCFGYIIQGDEGCSCGQVLERSLREAWEVDLNAQHTFELHAATPGYVTHDGISQVNLT
jgi:hypothetical protein